MLLARFEKHPLRVAKWLPKPHPMELQGLRCEGLRHAHDAEAQAPGVVLYKQEEVSRCTGHTYFIHRSSSEQRRKDLQRPCGDHLAVASVERRRQPLPKVLHRLAARATTEASGIAKGPKLRQGVTSKNASQTPSSSGCLSNFAKKAVEGHLVQWRQLRTERDAGLSRSIQCRESGRLNDPRCHMPAIPIAPDDQYGGHQ
mmetsp:Transcript_63323/g.137789  ORF Transcript_63323/g.137789 Transcript_63323/m.137789 type:complete len:200 (-) Transcript_63323:128-727(-)